MSYREPVDPVMQEVADLRKANDDLRSTRRQRARQAVVGGAVFAVVAAALGLLGYGMWFGLWRGTAWGATARRNAEREAVAYVRMLNPAARDVRAVCSGPCHEHLGLGCTVLVDGIRGVSQLCCDEDDPVANDGCTLNGGL